MKCPFCGNIDTQVKDSRASEDNKSIRRRRQCQKCQKRFTTFERFHIQQVTVVKRDNRREMFEASKIIKCLLIALRKRPINRDVITEAVTEIEQNLAETGCNDISSKEIGDMVLDKLKTIDFIGYIRYASVYNQFSTPDDFIKLVDKIED